MTNRIETLWRRLRDGARALAGEIGVLALAVGDPRVPWYAKLVAAVLVAYAASPIDLIPDFVPVLGYLDDLVLIPLGILLFVKLIPRDVLADLRRRGAAGVAGGRGGRIAAAVIVVVWGAAAAAIGWWLWPA